MKFTRTNFDDGSSFWGTGFEEEVFFAGARLRGRAKFSDCRFAGGTRFSDTTFEGRVSFRNCIFAAATFTNVTFGSGLTFRWSEMSGRFQFTGVSIHETLDIAETRFSSTVEIGPAACRNEVIATNSNWANGARISVATPRIDLSQARFEKSLALNVRYAAITLEGSTFEEASVITGVPPFEFSAPDGRVRLDESAVADSTGVDTPSIVSLRRADLANLALSNVALTKCQFSESHNLDKLRIDGDARFGRSPHGWRRSSKFPYFSHWIDRKVINEERQWRRQNGWRRPWSNDRRRTSVHLASADSIAQVYRSLRKAQEESRNDPGAADFYYGEMEMRRHSQNTPRAERLIIWLYWVTSGYGLRASRAIVILSAAILSTSWATVNFGFTGHAPSFTSTLMYYLESMVSIRNDGLGSTQFNTVGAALRLFLKVVGPVALALSILAVRNRVKR
ncbi:pentapeptide repeat-containing protein [Streptomyces sp. PKU-EA00015]|nr:pentapeptide repeat-containing protein [Streptomyces sp. PKU-EA00015]